jgi:L-amino acid N-acyltransferase YncA
VETSAATFEEDPPSPEEIARRMEKIAAAGLPFLVSEADGEVDGYAYLARYHERSAYRHTAEVSVYLAPDARGRGTGRALMDGLLAAGARAGVRQVIAIVGDTGDPAPLALPLACGFREVGRLESVGFKHGRWYDTVLLQRAL